MSKQVKKNTKNEIVEVAKEFFFTKGFDNTSTNDIVKHLGIARGTLYHHFKSKEEIMDTIIDQICEEKLSEVSMICQDAHMTVCERLVDVLGKLRLDDYPDIITHINQPENATLNLRLERMIIKNVTPILVELINEGIEEQIFSTKYPDQCVEMIVVYATTMFDDHYYESEMISDMETHVDAFIYNVEKLLSAESGTFGFVKQIFLLNNNND